MSGWIRFRVHGEEYALSLDVVAEVTLSRRPRLIPLIPTEVAGVINVKGEPLPALDGGVLLADRPCPDARHALVLDSPALRIGLRVEEVARIDGGRDLSRCEPSEAPGGAEPAHGLVRWLVADGDRIGLVDHDALLGRVADLLTRQVQHQEERESWPNAF